MLYKISKNQALTESCLQRRFSKCFLLLFPSLENRHFGETNMNDRSSRSHTIFRVVSFPVPVTPSRSQKLNFNGRNHTKESAREENTRAILGREGTRVFLPPDFPRPIFLSRVLSRHAQGTKGKAGPLAVSPLLELEAPLVFH